MTFDDLRQAIQKLEKGPYEMLRDYTYEVERIAGKRRSLVQAISEVAAGLEELRCGRGADIKNVTTEGNPIGDVNHPIGLFFEIQEEFDRRRRQLPSSIQDPESEDWKKQLKQVWTEMIDDLFLRPSSAHD